jgi:hypothetical protein
VGWGDHRGHGGARYQFTRSVPASCAMRMPCVCQRTLSAASAVSSRFDRALLAACRRPPTNALSTIRSRRARRTEPRSATHMCAQGVARGRAHRCRRSMRPCVCSSRSLTHSGGGGRGRVSTPVGVLDAPEAGDAIGAQDDRAWPRRWQAPPLRARACGGGAGPAWPTAIVVVARPWRVGLPYMRNRRARSRGCRRSSRASRAAAGLASGSAPGAGPVSGALRSSPRGPVPRPVPSAPGRAHVSACAAQERSE